MTIYRSAWILFIIYDTFYPFSKIPKKWDTLILSTCFYKAQNNSSQILLKIKLQNQQCHWDGEDSLQYYLPRTDARSSIKRDRHLPCVNRTPKWAWTCEKCVKSHCLTLQCRTNSSMQFGVRVLSQWVIWRSLDEVCRSHFASDPSAPSVMWLFQNVWLMKTTSLAAGSNQIAPLALPKRLFHPSALILNLWLNTRLDSWLNLPAQSPANKPI